MLKFFFPSSPRNHHNLEVTQIKQYAEQSTQTDVTMDLFGDSLKKSDEDNHHGRFMFKGTNTGLICTISISQSSNMMLTLTQTIMGFLAVHNITATPIRETTDSKLELRIDNLDTEQNYQHVLQFINWLGTMGFYEDHENPAALWFYANNGGDEILNFTNYPETIKQFLAEERTQFDTILKKMPEKYNTLVEVGCGAMENLVLAQNNQLEYYGIDFTAPRIVEAQQRIVQEKLSSCRVQCLDIINFEKFELQLASSARPVFIFPFNLLGNIAPIAKCITRFRLMGYDSLFSIYKTDYATNMARRDYYTNCGYTNIEIIPQEYGVIFRSQEGLYTIAYHQEYLVNLLNAFGFNVAIVDSSQYGIVLHAENRLMLSAENTLVSRAEIGCRLFTSSTLEHKTGVVSLHQDEDFLEAVISMH